MRPAALLEQDGDITRRRSAAISAAERHGSIQTAAVPPSTGVAAVQLTNIAAMLSGLAARSSLQAQLAPPAP